MWEAPLRRSSVDGPPKHYGSGSGQKDPFHRALVPTKRSLLPANGRQQRDHISQRWKDTGLTPLWIRIDPPVLKKITNLQNLIRYWKKGITERTIELSKRYRGDWKQPCCCLWMMRVRCLPNQPPCSCRETLSLCLCFHPLSVVHMDARWAGNSMTKFFGYHQKE